MGGLSQNKRLEAVDSLKKSDIPVLVATDDDIPDETIYEPTTELKRRVIDSIRRVAPEGYRIIKHDIMDDYILFIASEEPIKQEWIDRGRRLLKEVRL